MQTIFNLINYQKRTIFKGLQPAANTGKEVLCTGRFLIHQQLEVLHTSILVDDAVCGCDYRRLSGKVLYGDIGNSQVCKQQFL